MSEIIRTEHVLRDDSDRQFWLDCAKAALGGMAHRANTISDTGQHYATIAFKWADAMLAELKKREGRGQ